jgi:hypothetical protein
MYREKTASQKVRWDPFFFKEGKCAKTNIFSYKLFSYFEVGRQAGRQAGR